GPRPGRRRQGRRKRPGLPPADVAVPPRQGRGRGAGAARAGREEGARDQRRLRQDQEAAALIDVVPSQARDLSRLWAQEERFLTAFGMTTLGKYPCSHPSSPRPSSRPTSPGSARKSTTSSPP